MKLKVKPSDYNSMLEAVRTAMTEHPTLTPKEYKRRGLSEKRYRWDMLYLGRFDICSLYSYLNDTHIDSALRHIVATLDQEQ